MEMILLDWTRMGRSFCLAGVVLEKSGYRVVRPLPARNRHSPIHNVGWSPFTMEGHTRWEIFELVKPEPAPALLPHVEDHWVRSLRPRRRLAPVEQRRDILQATMARAGAPLFGAPLTMTRAAAHLTPGAGERSLVTVAVPASAITFGGSWRTGTFEPDMRVCLPVPDMGNRQLAVKDHFLLQWAATQAGDNLHQQIEALNAGVRLMGDRVAVRLGLSRSFPAREGEAGACWLMADGFFSLFEPQP